MSSLEPFQRETAPGNLLSEKPISLILMFLLIRLRRYCASSLLVILLSLSVSLAQDKIWIEAEHFEKRGGWVNDWQFIDQMGSPYLMAIGYGSPVADAETRIKTDKPGMYRMWVRSNDWYTETHPGKFQVEIDGKRSVKILGASGIKGWAWEDAGVVSLKSQSRLALKDLTGYYSRCDAIVFSRDLNWTPPASLQEITRLRKEFGAISSEVVHKGDYDVVVVGGGVAGTLAAVAAAREGARTVLIQNRDQLGGNASLENLVPPVGFRQTLLQPEERRLDPRETGLIEEVAPYGGQTYFEVGRLWPDRLKKLVEAEPLLDLYLNTHANGVTMKSGDTIEAVECVEIPSGQRIRFSGKMFIDCTGNGVIGLKSGAKHMYGREASSAYGETKAPEQADKTTLPSSLKYWFTEQSTVAPFSSPDWIYEFHSCADFTHGRHPKIGPIDNQWVIELGGTDGTYENAEAVRDDLFRLIYGIWDHLKNHCPEAKGKSEKMKLAWVGHVVGLRESYRLLGDYVMSERDVTEQPLLGDRVAYGGWGLDDHPSLGFFDKERLNNHTHSGVYHSVPYRSLYSKNIDNLMMAGRNISVTHVALTATRVMYATGVIGQAVGMAAGMCIHRKETPRGIYQKHLTDLQQKLLKEGAFLIEVPNEDPADLALSAAIESSSGRNTAYGIVDGFSRARFPAMFPSAQAATNAWIPENANNSPEWVSLRWDSPQNFNTVHVIFQNRGSLAYRTIRLEQFHPSTGWTLLKSVANEGLKRRLVIPVGQASAYGVRIVLPEPKDAGIAEVRVYDEPPKTLKMNERSASLEATFLKEVALPWETQKP
jgi:hypothetical protein